ncbi:tetratricopeptide repeat protein [bacterium]|nr:tetratricopeptide repeat protein [candidate division CSSED10-310 bacterium]
MNSQHHHNRIQMIPGVFLIMVLTAACLLWGGYHESGYALIHFGTALLLVISTLLTPNASYRPNRINLIRLTIAGIVIGLLINYLLNPWPSKGIDIAVLWFDCAICIYVLARIPKRFFASIIQLWIIVSLILVCMNLAIRFGDVPASLASILSHGYQFSFYAVLVFFVSLAGGFAYRRIIERYICILTCFAAFVSFATDFKSTAYAGLVTGLVIFVVLMRKKFKKEHLIFAAVSLGLAVAIGIILAGDVMFQDIKSHIIHENYFGGHHIPMLVALKTGASYMFWGTGLGKFEFVSGFYEPSGLDKRVVRAHNSYLQLFAETGIIGIILFLWIVVLCYQELKSRTIKHRLNNSMRYGLWSALAAAAAMSFFDFGLQIPANALAVTLLFGLLFSENMTKKQNSTMSPRRKFVFPGIAMLLVIQSIPALLASFYSEKAQLAFQNGRLARSIDQLETALCFRPWDDRLNLKIAETSLTFGMMTSDMNFLKSSISYADNAINANADNARAYYLKGVAAQQLDDKTLSRNPVSWFALAVEKDPTNAGYIIMLISEYIREDNIEKAAEAFNDFQKKMLPKKKENLVRNLLSVIMPLDNFLKTVPVFCRVLPPEIMVTFMNVLLEAKHTSLVSDNLESCAYLALKQSTVEDLLGYARIAFRINQYDLAEQLCKKGLTSVNDRPEGKDLWKLLGKVYKSTGKYEMAVKAFDASALYDPEDVSVMLEKIDCIRLMEGDAAALNYLKRLVKDYPESPMAHQALGQALERAGEKLEALYEYRLSDSLSGRDQPNYKIKQLSEQIGIDGAWQLNKDSIQ